MKQVHILRWSAPLIFVPVNVALIWPRNPVAIGLAFLALGLVVAWREHMYGHDERVTMKRLSEALKGPQTLTVLPGYPKVESVSPDEFMDRMRFWQSMKGLGE